MSGENIEAVKRANAALNLLHVAVAFFLQTAMGLIIARWPQSNGAYPAEAHQTAMLVLLGMEGAAFGWFGIATQSKPILAGGGSVKLVRTPPQNFLPLTVAAWNASAQQLVAGWRLAAVTSSILCLVLTTSLANVTGRPAILVQVVEANRLAAAQCVGGAPDDVGDLTVSQAKHAAMAHPISSPPLVLTWALPASVGHTDLQPQLRAEKTFCQSRW